jgi:nitrile hydratase accessory protein
LSPADDNHQPAFAAPWQAQAFALAVHLNEQGVFTWREWGEAFAAQRRRSAEHGQADAPEQYYHDWLCALEQLLVAKGSASIQALAGRKQAWIEAYLRTPHGNPVRLDPAR